MTTRIFAKKLRFMMAVNGDSNVDIACLLGVTNSRVTNLRCAATHPKDIEMKLISEYYGVPLEFFTNESPIYHYVNQRLRIQKGSLTMFYAIQNGDVYDLRFKYDPQLISLVKNVPGRRYVPEGKYWTIPTPHLGFLINEIKGTPYEKALQIQSEESLNQNETLDPTTEIPDIDISDIDIYVKEGSSLYAHQLAFLKYAKSKDRKGFILADSMGLGKSAEVMNYALYLRKKYGYKHCLIVACVNAAKYSWQDDIAKHTNGQEQGYILGSWIVSRGKNKGQIRYNGSGEDKVNDLKIGKMYGKEDGEDLPYFIITNIESIGRTKLGKRFTLEEELLKMAERGELSLVVVDECHKNMSPQSTQGKVILDMKKRDVNKKIQWIPMTGTPIKNKPTDVFTPLKLVDGHAFKSFYEWSHKFCIYGGFGGYEILGYRNIPLLKDMLQGNMIRRVKEEVLDLPPKIRMIEYVENTAYQNKLYDEISEEIYEKRDEILGSMNPLAHMLRLRQVNGSPELVDDSLLPLVNTEEYLKYNAKLARLIELVDDIVERGEKVIIFSNWVEPLRTAYKFLSKRHKTCCYTGSMSEADREKHRRVFVNNPDYPVMIGTIGAMGVSITLTVATNVIFYDDCWTPSDKEQAEDRSYRIGTTRSINVYTLIAKGTIDEYVYKILENKRAIAKYIVDGQLDLKKNPELFEFLLGKKAIENAN